MNNYSQRKEIENIIRLLKKKRQLVIEIQYDNQIDQERIKNKIEGVSTITDDEYEKIEKRLENNRIELKGLSTEIGKIVDEKRRIDTEMMKPIFYGDIGELEKKRKEKDEKWKMLDEYITNDNIMWYEIHKMWIMKKRYEDKIKYYEEYLYSYEQLEKEKIQMEAWKALEEEDKICNEYIMMDEKQDILIQIEFLTGEKELLEIYLRKFGKEYQYYIEIIIAVIIGIIVIPIINI